MHTTPVQCLPAPQRRKEQSKHQPPTGKSTTLDTTKFPERPRKYLNAQARTLHLQTPHLILNSQQNGITRDTRGASQKEERTCTHVRRRIAEAHMPNLAVLLAGRRSAFSRERHGREDPAGCGKDARVCEANPELTIRREHRAIFVRPIRDVSKVQLYPDKHTRRRRNERQQRARLLPASVRTEYLHLVVPIGYCCRPPAGDSRSGSGNQVEFLCETIDEKVSAERILRA